jgi:hypothetical protein
MKVVNWWGGRHPAFVSNTCRSYSRRQYRVGGDAGETHLCTSSHLHGKVLCRDLCDLLQDRLCALRLLVQPSLALLPRLAPTSLDHVSKQRPRTRAEPNERDSAVERLASEGNRRKDVLELLEHVRLVIQDPLLRIRNVQQRLREVGPDSAEHLDLHAHRLGYDEDVAEDDGGVQEAIVAADGLHRDLAGQLGGAADVEERVFLADGLELGEVTPCLPHDPDGRVVERGR